MKIEHMAVWVEDLEKMRHFYETYLGGVAGGKYVNTTKGFSSYFLSFNGGGSRIELMHRQDIPGVPEKRGFVQGIAHLAFAMESKDAVNALTERFRADGFTIAGEPRTSGDGYYESAVYDPEGNYIEIVC